MVDHHALRRVINPLAAPASFPFPHNTVKRHVYPEDSSGTGTDSENSRTASRDASIEGVLFVIFVRKFCMSEV